MLSASEIQRLRSQSGDSAVYQQLLLDPIFKAKVDRVQGAYPNMTEFEKIKFPSAMIDIHLGKKPPSTMNKTGEMLNSSMGRQGAGSGSEKGAFDTLIEDPLRFAGQTAKNVIPSTASLIGNVASLARHPLQTAKSVFQMGVGGVINTMESIASLAGVKNAEDIFDFESEEIASAVGDFYVQRYGSLDAAATTLRDDPAGFLSDLGAVVTGVSGALRVGSTALGSATGAATKTSTALTTLGRGVRAAQSVSGKGIRVGINMEPIVITGRGVVMAGRGARSAARSAGKALLPEALVTKALKINPSDIRNFQNIKGNQLPGEWMMEKGILSGGDLSVTPDSGLKFGGISPVGRTRSGIMDDLEKVANKAKATVDSELLSVKQTYNLIDDVPEEAMKLVEFLEKEAIAHDHSELLTFVRDLIRKENVSLTDLNNLKRYAYETFRTYKRSNVAADSGAAAQINRYESVLRSFIEDQAEIKGLPDIGLLNLDTMKAHDILDAMYKADAAIYSKGRLGIGLMDTMFGLGGFALTRDLFSTAGIVVGRRVIESTIFRTTMAKWLSKLDPRQINVLKSAFKTGKHTKESRIIMRKVVSQTANDIKNQRIAEMENTIVPHR